MNKFVNSSGQGANAIVPEEIKGWNWGAFVFNWIWGVANKGWKALWCLVPFVNIVMIFVTGFKGNEWSWKNKKWESIEEFKRVQKIWSRVGIGVLVVGLLFVLTTPLLLLFGGFFGKQIETTIDVLETKNEIVEMVGMPFEQMGIVSGSSSVSGPSGKADIGFSIEGPKGEAKVQSVLKKDIEGWSVVEGKVLFEDGSVISIP